MDEITTKKPPKEKRSVVKRVRELIREVRENAKYFQHHADATEEERDELQENVDSLLETLREVRAILGKRNPDLDYAVLLIDREIGP
jgi:chromatin segregation and condensation protein Rec8/ScpA/Scc1 (kleisin family)